MCCFELSKFLAAISPCSSIGLTRLLLLALFQFSSLVSFVFQAKPPVKRSKIFVVFGTQPFCSPVGRFVLNFLSFTVFELSRLFPASLSCSFQKTPSFGVGL